MIPPGWWQYEDKPVHSEVLLSGARHRCVAAARRSGKTAIGQTIALTSAARPGVSVGYFLPTYAQVRELVIEPMALALGPERCRVNRIEHRIDLVGGGTIWGKSTERPDLLVGRGYDVAILDECELMPEQTYDAVIRPMLATTGGRVVALGSPRGTENMLYRFFDLGQRREDGWRSWLLTAYEAGTIPREEVERSREEAERAGPTAKKLWEREWLADFSAFVGQVYAGWDRRTMVVDKLPDGLPTRVVGGVDWGFSEGHAGVVEVAALYGDTWYVVDEVSAYGKTMPGFWVPEISRVMRRWNVTRFFCDPSQEGTIQLLQREVRRHGPGPHAVFTAADNAVEDGVLAVAGLMDAGRLKVHARCQQLIRRIPGYVWERVRTGDMADTYKDKPRKVRDDELDAMRYAVFSAIRKPERRPF